MAVMGVSFSHSYWKLSRGSENYRAGMMNKPSRLAEMSWLVFLSLPRVVDRMNCWAFFPRIIDRALNWKI